MSNDSISRAPEELEEKNFGVKDFSGLFRQKRFSCPRGSIQDNGRNVTVATIPYR